ncbi:MAG: ABC transporter ATP-binding protein, partial [Candidatus Limiplasma sp.]|nr:ABC transporter ATP-binding protein [Candidatus Limiplasma sp.]
MLGKKKDSGYISARESRKISRKNRAITRVLDAKRDRKNVNPSEYTTVMRNPDNVGEFDDLHSY